MTLSVHVSYRPHVANDSVIIAPSPSLCVGMVLTEGGREYYTSSFPRIFEQKASHDSMKWD